MVPLSEERHGGAGCRVRGSACGTPPADRVSAPFEVSIRRLTSASVAHAGVSIFELSRIMGTSVKQIDKTYGHLARDSEDAIRARLNARTARVGVELASESDGD